MPTVTEDSADFSVGDIERETCIVLADHPFRRPIIIVHPLADDVEEDGPVVDAVDDVDVALHQSGLVPDGGRQFLPGAETGVENAHPAHAGHPQFPIPRVTQVIDRMRSGVGVHDGEIVRVVAVQDRSAAGNDPEEIPVLYPIGETESVEVADRRPEAFRLAVQLVQGG